MQELLATLGALVVREEFCREVEECGGLTVLMDVMVTYPDDEVSTNMLRDAHVLLTNLCATEIEPAMSEADEGSGW